MQTKVKSGSKVITLSKSEINSLSQAAWLLAELQLHGLDGTLPEIVSAFERSNGVVTVGKSNAEGDE